MPNPFHRYSKVKDHNAPKQETEGSQHNAADSVNPGEPSAERDNYNIAKRALVRALVTAILCALVVIILKVYDDIKNFSRRQKYAMNSLLTAASLLLALNFFDAFSSLAGSLRWRYLAERPRDANRVDLILGIEKFQNVAKLLYYSKKTSLTAFICFVWLLIGLAAQASVAIISLTYEVNDGTNYNDTITVPGTYVTSDLSCYYRWNTTGPTCPNGFHNPRDAETFQAIAHGYGDAFPSVSCGNYTTLDEVLQSEFLYPYYCRRPATHDEPAQFAYRFLDWNPDDKHLSSYPRMTNRIITATSGDCYEYNITAYGDLVNDDNNHLAAWSFPFTNGTTNGRIRISAQHAALSGTTYVYRGERVPWAQNQSQSCGPRCMWTWAYRAKDPPSNSLQEAVFQCPITISEVLNSGGDPRFEVPDTVAMTAAASIALQGRRAGLVSTPEETTDRWIQYQLYPFGSRWSIQGQPRRNVGANMAEYAIRSIAAMALQNPSINITDSTAGVPTLGTFLDVKWPYLITLMGCIATAHLVLALSMIWLTKGVVIPKESQIVMASIMKPLMEVEYPDGEEAEVDGENRVGGLATEQSLYPVWVNEGEQGSRMKSYIYGKIRKKVAGNGDDEEE